MKRTVLIIVATIALLVSLMVALAANNSETPNDPDVNPNANACYTGGSMAAKCKLDEQLWIAGWYEIRLERGIISRDQVPDPYKWLLIAHKGEPAPLPTPTQKPL